MPVATRNRVECFEKVVDPAEVFKKLQELVGVWHGEGRGGFPTVDPFRYRETLVFESIGPEPIVHFQQKTWLISDDDRNDEFLHWESGFLIVQSEGQIDLLNAQNSGRVEVLSGQMCVSGAGKTRLSCESVVHGHDGRMVATTRVFNHHQNALAYTVGMATTQVGQVTQHLQCALARRS